jgi:hypothetical protein
MARPASKGLASREQHASPDYGFYGVVYSTRKMPQRPPLNMKLSCVL